MYILNIYIYIHTHKRQVVPRDAVEGERSAHGALLPWRLLRHLLWAQPAHLGAAIVGRRALHHPLRAPVHVAGHINPAGDDRRLLRLQEAAHRAPRPDQPGMRPCTSVCA